MDRLADRHASDGAPAQPTNRGDIPLRIESPSGFGAARLWNAVATFPRAHRICGDTGSLDDDFDIVERFRIELPTPVFGHARPFLTPLNSASA